MISGCKKTSNLKKYIYEKNEIPKCLLTIAITHHLPYFIATTGQEYVTVCKITWQ